MLAEQSKEAVANIQAVTDNVNQAVGNLATDSNRLLDFVDTDIVDSFNKFEEMADAYNDDASRVNDLVADFSAVSWKRSEESHPHPTTERPVQQISHSVPFPSRTDLLRFWIVPKMLQHRQKS